MKNLGKDILQDTPSLKDMPFEIPQGYFDGLKIGLKMIPRQSASRRTNLWKYVSVAAVIALIVAAGGFFLDYAASGEEYFTEEDYIVYSDDLTNAIFQEYSDQYAATSQLTEDEIIEYLIYTGLEVEDIEPY